MIPTVADVNDEMRLLVDQHKCAEFIRKENYEIGFIV